MLISYHYTVVMYTINIKVKWQKCTYEFYMIFEVFKMSTCLLKLKRVFQYPFYIFSQYYGNEELKIQINYSVWNAVHVNLVL